MAEHTIPQREMSDWQVNPYERMRTLYPVEASSAYLTDVVTKEALHLYKKARVVSALFEFSQVYGPAMAAHLQLQGNEIHPTLPGILSNACLAGVLVAVDVNAHTLTEADRRRLFNAEFEIPVPEDTDINTPQEYNRVLAGVILDIVEEVEQAKHDMVPLELKFIGEAMFRESHPSLALEQEKAFGIGASMVYDVMVVATHPANESVGVS